MRLGSLCSGAGSLDLAVEQVFGAETVWHCEIDDAASKVLAHRWPDVPNHRDLTTTDWSAVEPVDILTGGYPCQPFSHAGKRKGTDDERHIWPDVREAIRRLRPRYTFLENVAGHRSLGFNRVLGDLAEDGLHARWTSVRASDVGAPHQRERLFILVTPPDADDTTCCSGHSRSASASGDGQTDRIVGRCSDAANATRDGRDERWPEPAGQLGGSHAPERGAGPVELLPTPTARDHKGHNQRQDETCLTGALLPTPSASDGIGGGPNNPENRLAQGHHVQLIDLGMLPDEQWGKYSVAIRRWEQLTRSAPSPTEPNRNGNPRLNPAFSEWMMGWPAGWVTDVPGISRNDQLRIIGNGVVVMQAVSAFQWLLNLEVAA